MPANNVNTYGFYTSLSPNELDGPRAMSMQAPMTADAVLGAVCLLNLQQDAIKNKFAFAQSVFIDADQVAIAATLRFKVLSTGYTFKVRGRTQGWYPLVSTNGMDFQLDGAAALVGVSIPIILTNVPGLMTSWNLA